MASLLRFFIRFQPHSEDTVCVYVPEEKVLFLGDSTSEDFFNDGYMDKDKLKIFDVYDSINRLQVLYS